MKKAVTPAPEEAIENQATPTNAVAETQTQAMTNPEENASGIQGQWGRDDIQLPVISLVQKSGEMSETWPQGTFVYDKNLALTTSYDNAEKPAEDAVFRVPVTVVGLKKYWRENRNYKDPGFAKNWDSKEEAEGTPVTDALGNPVPAGPDSKPVLYKYGNKGVGTFAEAAIITFLFPVPDEYSEFDYEGQGYARAIYRAASTAWQVAKTLYSGALGTARRNAPKGQVPVVKEYAVNWELGSKKIAGDDIYFKPFASNLGRHDEKFIEWIENEVLVLP